MNQQVGKTFLNHLYTHIDGFSLSKQAIEKLDSYYLGYEYGEATFESFYKLLSHIQLQENAVFYDLGSGVGKKVFIASLCFSFSKSVGIEILKELHTASQQTLDRFLQQEPNFSQQIIFKNQDYNSFDFSDADVIYISLAPTALQIEFNGRLRRKLEKLKKGAIIISSNVIFDSPYFEIIRSEGYEYAGGFGTAYFHKKITDFS